MLKIIGRYIFREIATPFLIILFVLTFVLLMGQILQIMDLMLNKGIHAGSIAYLIILLMPSFLLFTLPIALLISVLMAMGRLSADNEITAMKTSGLSLMQIYYPIAIASLMTFILAMIISYFLVPHSNNATKKLLFELARQNATVAIKQSSFNDSFDGLLLYADKIPPDGEYMEGVFISDRRTLSEPSTITARKARLISDPRLMRVKLRLEDGSIHTVSDDLKNYRKVDFAHYEVNLDLSAVMSEATEQVKSSTEMTFLELLEASRAPGLDPAAARELTIEAHKIFSIPLSCLFFALLAMPLGIKSHRAVKSRGFAVGMIIVATYYLLRIGGEALVETGRLSPWIGVWSPNMLFALLGLYLFMQAHLERSLLRDLVYRLSRVFKS